MFSLLFIKNNLVPKLVVNLLNVSRTYTQKSLACKSNLLTGRLFEKPRIHYIETQSWKSHLVKRYNQTQYQEKNTNVANNVILYKFGKIRFFKVAHFFGMCSIVWWTFLMWYLYKDNFFSKFWSEPFKKFVDDNLLCVVSLMCSTLLGPLFYVLLVLFSTRLVKCVVLNKGGKLVTFITLHPLKSRTIITVPVEKVYCLRPRSDPLGPYTFLKIDSYKFNFLIDKSGTYVNGDLFDHTVAWRK